MIYWAQLAIKWLLQFKHSEKLLFYFGHVLSQIIKCKGFDILPHLFALFKFLFVFSFELLNYFFMYFTANNMAIRQFLLKFKRNKKSWLKFLFCRFIRARFSMGIRRLRRLSGVRWIWGISAMLWIGIILRIQGFWRVWWCRGT